MTRSDQVFQSAEILADDMLLDAVGGGRSSGDDPLVALLERWRAELDLAATSTPAPTMDFGTSGRRPIKRLRHAGAAGLAAVALLAGGGAAAAAVSGPTGPLGVLHRTLFGTSHPADSRTRAITTLLEDAADRIASAQHADTVSPTTYHQIEAQLRRAAQLLRAYPTAPDALRQRLDLLRRALAALPRVVSAHPATQHSAPSSATASTIRPAAIPSHSSRSSSEPDSPNQPGTTGDGGESSGPSGDQPSRTVPSGETREPGGGNASVAVNGSDAGSGSSADGSNGATTSARDNSETGADG